MKLFESPEETINACVTECEKTFDNVYPPSFLDLQLPKQYQPMFKQAFKTGFMAGIQFLSTNILETIPKENIKK